MFHQFTLALSFYLAFAVFSLIGLPFTARTTYNKILAYASSRLVGFAVFGYGVWLFCELHILNYENHAAISLFLMLGAGVGAYLSRGFFNGMGRKILWMEGVTLAAYAGYLFLRSHNSAINSTEGFMNIALLAASGKTHFFPFEDPWYQGKTINYYYYGYYLVSLLSNLAKVPYELSYNFALGLIYAYSALLSAALVYAITGMRKAAIMAAFLVTSAGTLLFAGCAMDAFLSDKKACDFHTVAGLGDGLPYSIREYPSFSFTVGDLHPHVMALPFFVLALMFIYILIRDDRPRAGAAALVGFALATSGMINSWDFITLASVIGVATSMKARQSFYAFPSAKKIAGMWAMVFFVVLLAAGLFMWPYLRDLQSPVPGIGFSPSYVSLHKLKDIQYPTPLSAQVGIWGLFAAGMVLSIIWMRRKICNEELTVSLTIVALGIITGMELVFVRDMYSITFPTFFRANTTYKFGYHAWVMLCIVFSVWMAALCERMQGKRIWVPRLLMILAIAGGMFYPVQAIRQYYLVDPFGPTLNGMAWLWHSDAGDFATVNYINHMFPERAVIAEAVGDFGMYSCVTSYTGMITPMGWSGHEWAWRFHEDKRNPQETGWYKIAYVRGDIQRLYETADVEEAARIIKDYHIDYVYIGDVEQQTYRRLHEEKFSRLGKVVLTSFNARLYKVNPDYKTN